MSKKPSKKTTKANARLTISTKGLFGALDLCFNADLIPFFEGNKGTGKTAVIGQWAETQGMTVVTHIMSHKSPEFVGGIPVPEIGADQRQTGKIVVCMPDIIASVERAKAENNDAPVLLFFDELPNAALELQSPLFQLFLERRLGEYKLPDNVFIAAAGNPQEDSIASMELAEPLIDRMVIYRYAGPTKDEFMAYASSANMAPVITGFLGTNPEWIHQMGPELSNEGETVVPTPRAWERASQLITAGEKIGKKYDSADMNAAFAGTVGTRAYFELETFFAEEADLPSPEQVMKSPKRTKLPTRSIGKMLIALSLARNTHNEKDFTQCFEYVQRLPVEILGLYLSDIANNKDRRKALSHDAGIDALGKYVDVIATPYA